MHKPPLILTAAIDEHAFAYFNLLRQQHFPASINYLDAHLTLFHALPYEEAIIDVVKTVAQSHAAFTLAVAEPVSIGRGVAFKIESQTLAVLHRNLQKEWYPFLTAQDKQKLWPHITIQNKVTTQEANKLLSELKINFAPFTAVAAGLQLWEYLNGPWKLLRTYFFTKDN